MQTFKVNETNAAYRRIYMFLASPTDGYSPVTSPLTGATVNIFVNGTATPTPQPLTPATLTHIAVGHWYYEIPAVYLYTAGVLTVTVSDTSIRPVVLMGNIVTYDWTTTTGITAADVWANPTRTLSAGAIVNSTFSNNAIVLRLANDAIASNARFTTYDSFSGYPLLSQSAQHQVSITGSHHAAADVHKFQPNVIDSAATDASFIDEITAASNAPTAIEVADAILNRQLDSSGDSVDVFNERTVRSALRAMRNKVIVNNGNISVYKEDDTVAAWEGTVSNTANVTVNPDGGS